MYNPPKTAVAPSMPSRPKRSIRNRLVVWTIIAMIVPTVLSMVGFRLIVRDAISKEADAEGRLLAEMVAASLKGRLADGFDRHEGELLSSIGRDKRVAFIFITDSNRNIRHAGIFDPKAMKEFQRNESTFNMTQGASVAEPQVHHFGNDLVVHSLPLPKESATGQTATFEGTLVLGLHRPATPSVLTNFNLAQAASALLACLIVIPVVSIVMRRWTRPLADLVTVTRRLAEGRPPEPIAVGTMDELGYLSCAFNDMASRLIVSRRELVDANESLEQRVKDRTAELHEAMTRLDEMASTDPLTHLANRRAFNDALARFGEDARRSSSDLLAILIDLDGFKPVNDTYGHDVGDELLVLAAEVMQRNCRDFDMAARLGGDEFAMLIRRTDVEEATARAQRMLAEFTEEATALLSRFEKDVPVSMSIGIASRHQTRAAGGEQLVQFADRALYVAKGNGKSCVHVSDAQVAKA